MLGRLCFGGTSAPPFSTVVVGDVGWCWLVVFIGCIMVCVREEFSEIALF
jgi:hypothetical protein